MNIDWSEEPEDATHAGTTARVQIPVFYKDIREDKYSYWRSDGDGWREYAIGHPECTPLIDLPNKQDSWNGEGLPPVGTVCDMHIDDFGWITGTVVVHIDLDEPIAVAHNGEEVFHGNASDFRPIKTAEQLEEEEKKQAIDDMQRIYEESMLDYSSRLGHASRPAIKALYEAGYRKQ